MVTLLLYAIIPNLFQTLDSVKYNDRYLVETREKTIIAKSAALQDDVGEGRAEFVGQLIRKKTIRPPVGIFFERVARIDPENPESGKVGLGRFHAEIWILSWFGFDFTHLNKAQLNALRFGFDAIFPFVLLFLISYITKPVSKQRLDRFFAKMHTPVQPTPEAEETALQTAYASPQIYDKDKLFPGSHWEIMKPKGIDYLGFGGSWVLVGIVILLLWGMVNLR